MGSNQSDSVIWSLEHLLMQYLTGRFVDTSRGVFIIPLNFSIDYIVRKQTLIQQIFKTYTLTLFFDWNNLELHSDSSEKRNRRIEIETNSDLSESHFFKSGLPVYW